MGEGIVYFYGFGLPHRYYLGVDMLGQRGHEFEFFYSRLHPGWLWSLHGPDRVEHE